MGESLRWRNSVCKGPVAGGIMAHLKNKEEQSCCSPEHRGVSGREESSQKLNRAGLVRRQKEMGKPKGF